MSWTLKQQVMKVTVIMTVSQVVPRIYTVRPERNFRMSSFFVVWETLLPIQQNAPRDAHDVQRKAALAAAHRRAKRSKSLRD